VGEGCAAAEMTSGCTAGGVAAAGVPPFDGAIFSGAGSPHHGQAVTPSLRVAPHFEHSMILREPVSLVASMTIAKS